MATNTEFPDYHLANDVAVSTPAQLCPIADPPRPPRLDLLLSPPAAARATSGYRTYAHRLTIISTSRVAVANRADPIVRTRGAGLGLYAVWREVAVSDTVYEKDQVMRVPWLLCDYGEVLSTSQPAEDLDAMVNASGYTRTEFLRRYWLHRPGYDRADLGAREYWQQVMQSDVDGRRLAALVELDVRSWLHPDTVVLDAVLRAHDRGYRLAMLSNAPSELADALDTVSWLASFKPKIFSCRLRASKPDPAVYAAAIKLINARLEDVVFLDDRAANVDAARELGIRAELFTDVSQVDRLHEPDPGDNPRL